MHTHNVSFPDCRVRVPGKEFQSIAERVAEGERQEQVAADYGVNPRTIRRILAKHAAITTASGVARWDLICHMLGIPPLRLVGER